MFTKSFALDLLERAVSTFAQAFLGAYAVVGPQKAVIAAGIAAGLSALKCLAATQVGAKDSGSLLPASEDPPQDAGQASFGLLAMVAVITIGVFLGLTLHDWLHITHN
jgi:hypothetical protein